MGYLILQPDLPSSEYDDLDFYRAFKIIVRRKRSTSKIELWYDRKHKRQTVELFRLYTYKTPYRGATIWID